MKIKEYDCLKRTSFFARPGLPIVVTRDTSRTNHGYIPMHDHEFTEIVLIASGSTTHVTAGKSGGSYRLVAGDFFIIHPGHSHGYINPSKDLVLYNLLYDNQDEPRDFISSGSPFAMEIDPSTARSQSSLNPRPLGRLPPRALDMVANILELIHTEEKPLSDSSPAAIEALFSSAVAKFSDAYKTPKSIDPSISAAAKMLEERFAENLTHERIAAEFSMSPCVFLKRFRSAYGVSPYEYLMKTRLAKAESLLIRTDKTILTIAVECGFHDASHLRKALMAKTNLNPGAYRKRHRGIEVLSA